MKEDQLIEELMELRRRIAESEALEVESQSVKEKLKTAQKYAEALIHSSIDMIIAVDTDRRIIEFNESAQKTFGYSSEEVLGKHVGILYSDQESGLAVIEAIRQTGRFTGEIVNRRKNGETFLSFISASVLRDAGGEVIGFMGISRDITERKRMERRLRESEKMASLAHLISGAAHEVNNPISFIYSNISYLRSCIQDMKDVLDKYRDVCKYPLQELADRVSHITDFEKQIELEHKLADLDRLVDDMEEGARRIKRIMEGLTAFSHSYKGKIDETDINEDIERSLHLLKDHYRDGITIHRDYADLPEVKCYAGQLNQVFMNLIANACHAIEDQEGDIWITTRLADDTVVISIRDNGVGIAEGHIEHIFDPFFTTKDVGAGTGLGLTVSYGIIQRHNGEISVDSQVGSGTTFTVRVPVNFAGSGASDDGYPTLHSGQMD